jgi:hypothetical protein
VGVQANLDVEVKEVKLDGLVRAEGLARADVGKERIADLAGSAGDAHRHRRLRHFDCGNISHSEPCNADAQESSSVSMATSHNQSQDADPRKTKVASMWLQSDESASSTNRVQESDVINKGDSFGSYSASGTRVGGGQVRVCRRGKYMKA